MKRLRLGAMIGCMAVGLVSGCRSVKDDSVVPKPNAYELPVLPDSVWRPLVKTFEKQARGISQERLKPLFAQYAPTSKLPVSVAIVDLVPPPSASRPERVHNEAVIRVVSSLFCSGLDPDLCRKNARLYSGAPSRSRNATGAMIEPSYSVSLEELSQAISTIVAQAPPDQHVVINVALGLDSIKLALGGVSLDPLIEALKRASCMGALVIAPAGNVTGTDGPLIPAAFESRPAPTAADCEGLGIHQSPRTKEAYAPLVYAVGGLDPLDQRLSIGRPYGFPRLAAFAMSVTTEGPVNSYSPPLSGTSMSAAIVTGVAAAVWTAKPDLDAHQVMAHVYKGGVPLDGGFQSKRAQTEFCLGNALGPCPDPVRRVFLCGALESALQGNFGCDRTPSTSYERPRWPQTTEPTKLKTPTPCDVSRCGLASGPIGSQIPNGAVPQPWISGCPGCMLDSLNARISGQLQWYSLPQQMMSVVVDAYQITDELISSNSSMAPWRATDRFSFPYTAPPSTFYMVLEVTFKDSQGIVQTDYQAVLP